MNITVPTAARGEVLLPVVEGKAPFGVRFGMRTMRALTKLTGKAPSEFGQLLADDYNEALTAIVCAAVRSHVPGAEFGAEYNQDDAADLIDRLTPAEAQAVAEAIVEAVTVGNPLLTSITAMVASKNQAARAEALLPESGSSTSTSPTEN